jgi:hypothetical protein
VYVAKLTASTRKKIPAKDFAVAGRKYPVENERHARNALSRSSGKSVHAQVVRKVHAKYPDIKIAGGSKGKSREHIEGWTKGKK